MPIAPCWFVQFFLSLMLSLFPYENEINNHRSTLLTPFPCPSVLLVHRVRDAVGDLLVPPRVDPLAQDVETGTELAHGREELGVVMLLDL